MTEEKPTALEDFEDISVRPETIQAFQTFLTENLSMPCEVVTSTEFDRYQLDNIEDSNNDLFGLLGCVKPAGDEKKQLKIPLCDLRSVDNRSENFILLNSYASWFINNQ